MQSQGCWIYNHLACYTVECTITRPYKSHCYTITPSAIQSHYYTITLLYNHYYTIMVCYTNCYTMILCAIQSQCYTITLSAVQSLLYNHDMLYKLIYNETVCYTITVLYNHSVCCIISWLGCVKRVFLCCLIFLCRSQKYVQIIALVRTIFCVQNLFYCNNKIVWVIKWEFWPIFKTLQSHGIVATDPTGMFWRTN